MPASTIGRRIIEFTLMLSSRNVQAIHAQKPANTQGNQEACAANREYANEKMDTEMIPIIMAWVAAEAKAFPCSRARKNATGAEVKGSPTSQPLTVGPQWRPAKLTPPMKAGTRTNLRTNVTQSTLINRIHTPACCSRLSHLPPNHSEWAPHYGSIFHMFRRIA